ncbi:MAG: alpha/beta fold hydrolase [Archangium sp.]
MSALLLSLTLLTATPTAVTARTQYVEHAGIRFAYRRFGKKSEVPLVLLMHTRGTMDHWDPALLDALAKKRTVIVFDNVGVASTTGTTPESFAEMADGAATFVKALGYSKVDLLGFSIGGAVAQELLVHHGALVRRAILAGTAPRGGVGLNTRLPRVVAIVSGPVINDEDFLFLFFTPSELSQQRGRAFISRRNARTVDVEPPVSAEASKAQAKARQAWGEPLDGGSQGLENVTIPVLVANGSADLQMPTQNSFALYQQLPHAQLALFPDSGHGFLFQYPAWFAETAITFLDRGDF